MTRVLFTTNAMSGHVRPGLQIARELRHGGHDVLWYTGRDYQPLVESTGARFTPVSAELEFANAPRAPGLLNFNKLVLDVFINRIPGYVADLAPVFEAFRPDVVVADHAFLAGPLLAEKRGIASVFISTGPLNLSSVDTAPFGTGLAPSATAAGRLRNRLLYWLTRHVLLREAHQVAARLRAGLGLPRLGGFFLDWAPLIADRYLQPGIAEFEYPRSDLPACVEFVGATLAFGVDQWSAPPWWPQVAQARAAGRPVILLTQGTVATDPANLLLPAVAALAGQDHLVVATSGGRDPEGVLPAARRPANLRLSPFIPFTEILPMADLMITNGGYGGVQTALACGVPLVVAGTSEDKQEVNARVAWSGAGVSLRTDRPRPAQIARAVRTVLGGPAYQARARELAAAFARYPGAPRAAGIVLETAAARRPGTGTALTPPRLPPARSLERQP